MEFDNIKDLFENMIVTIDFILKDDFYSNKYSAPQIKVLVEKWYSEYREKNTLKIINVKDLKFLYLEITEIFDIYFENEWLKANYTERLLYYFGLLERNWKDEMLREI